MERADVPRPSPLPLRATAQTTLYREMDAIAFTGSFFGRVFGADAADDVAAPQPVDGESTSGSTAYCVIA